MNKIKSLALAAAISSSVALLAGAAPARADEVYSNDLRLGAYFVFYHVKADDLAGPYVPPGVNIQVKDLTTLYAAYVRRLSPHFAVELAAGLPPVTKTYGKGPAMLGSVPYDGVEISTARWFAPTVLLEYNFFDESSAFRPFIGVGVNYTNFYDRNSTAGGNAATGGPTKISLSSSVGPAATAGLSYRITSRWHVYASYSISRVNSNLTANTAGVIRTTHVQFGPQTLVISAGYSF